MTNSNILQYKTEGVANIFAPTILINGVRHVGASNSFDNIANYPGTTTTSQQNTRHNKM